MRLHRVFVRNNFSNCLLFRIIFVSSVWFGSEVKRQQPRWSRRSRSDYRTMLSFYSKPILASSRLLLLRQHRRRARLACPSVCVCQRFVEFCARCVRMPYATHICILILSIFCGSLSLAHPRSLRLFCGRFNFHIHLFVFVYLENNIHVSVSTFELCSARKEKTNCEIVVWWILPMEFIFWIIILIMNNTIVYNEHRSLAFIFTILIAFGEMKCIRRCSQFGFGNVLAVGACRMPYAK